MFIKLSWRRPIVLTLCGIGAVSLAAQCVSTTPNIDQFFKSYGRYIAFGSLFMAIAVREIALWFDAKGKLSKLE